MRKLFVKLLHVVGFIIKKVSSRYTGG